MSKKDDFKKKIKEIKQNIDDGAISNDEELEQMVNDLFEMMDSSSLKDKILRASMNIIRMLVILFLSFCISFAFSTNIFTLDNKWYVLLVFFILSLTILIEKIVANLFKMSPQTYLLGILGLFNISLFTVLNFFLNFSTNTMLFNVLYCVGFGIYFLANFIIMRRKFRKVLE